MHKLAFSCYNSKCPSSVSRCCAGASCELATILASGCRQKEPIVWSNVYLFLRLEGGEGVRSLVRGCQDRDGSSLRNFFNKRGMDD